MKYQMIEIVENIPFNAVDFIAKFEDETVEKSIYYLIHLEENSLSWGVNVRDKVAHTSYQETFNTVGEAVKYYNAIKIKLKPKERVKEMISIGYFHGSCASWEREIGYKHGEVVNEYLDVVLQKILDANLNVMVQQGVKSKESCTVWIDSGQFKQR